MREKAKLNKAYDYAAETGLFTRKISPYLHVEQDRVYNPLTDRSIVVGQVGFAELQALYKDDCSIDMQSRSLEEYLREEGWLLGNLAEKSRHFFLKYVSLEASTTCNQSCLFCPVSIHPRKPHFMPLNFYEKIVEQLSAYRGTIKGVSMIHYNEATIDKRFLDQIRLLRNYGLTPILATNGTGMTPKKVDAIISLGGLGYLSINLSTIDRQGYKKGRGKDHLHLVLRNLDYMRDLEIAPQMEIAVLGRGDINHQRDFNEISARFAGSRFQVKYYEFMDRAGNMPIGIRPGRSAGQLCGCEQTGSRPFQWVHITPHGKCVLCAQDYYERYVVGDLTRETLQEVLSGERMALLRRWAYGVEEAPDDFVCRHCIYARTR
jgi:wyosine [tRNA(Phe)-imidazoG37] synthetase (radical SAM superfamily)